VNRALEQRALNQRHLPKDYERTLSIIGAENEYMACLVNDLLILARADAGQAGLKWEDLDLGELTLDVVGRLSPLARRNQIELLTDDLPELKIHGDRIYLTQMLTNLVEHAIKYTSGVGQHVWVEGERQWVANREWGYISIKDDGPGIAAEHLPHLFDRFYRVDKTRSHQPESERNGATAGGSGLGLAIVQWVAHSHGGTIDVHSQTGEDAIFQVRLPLVVSTSAMP
jgi:signal transduction histidine kinase